MVSKEKSRESRVKVWAGDVHLGAASVDMEWEPLGWRPPEWEWVGKGPKLWPLQFGGGEDEGETAKETEEEWPGDRKESGGSAPQRSGWKVLRGVDKWYL